MTQPEHAEPGEVGDITLGLPGPAEPPPDEHPEFDTEVNEDEEDDDDDDDDEAEAADH